MGRQTYKTDFQNEYGDKKEKCEPEPNIDEANLVTSLIAEDIHYPVIDIDVECELIPSSTKGHYHLYIQKPLTADIYWKLMDALVEAKIVESGYVSASKARGFTAVRLPWIKKERVDTNW